MSALNDAVQAFERAWLALKEAIIQGEPATPPPTSPPPTTPPPATTRLRAAVTAILLQEFEKQTSFLPGGANGSATAAETLDPNRAIQKWVDNLINNNNALLAPEAELRATMATMIAKDVAEYQWAVSYPPTGLGTTPPAPTPPAPAPGPTPPPTSGNHWDQATIDEAVRQITTKNEGLIANVDNNKDGWYSQGSVVMGGVWNDSGAPNWAPTSGRGIDYWWPNFNWWAALFTEQGNLTPDGWVEVMGQETQLLYKGAPDWTRLGRKNAEMGWGEHYQPNMIDSTGRKILVRAGSVPDSMSFQLPQAGAPHWIDGNAIMAVPNVSNIEGVLTTMLIRIDPRGDQRVRCLAQVGGDPKPGSNLTWYPGFAVSSVQRVTKSWRRVTAINVEGAKLNYGGNRVITLARLRAAPPLL